MHLRVDAKHRLECGDQTLFALRDLGQRVGEVVGRHLDEHVERVGIVHAVDHDLIVGGITLLEQGYTSNYQIVVDRVNNSDTLDVLVEMTPDHFSDSLAEITKREKGLVAALKAMLGIYAQVHLVSPKSIARSEGKAIRVIDKRRI